MQTQPTNAEDYFRQPVTIISQAKRFLISKFPVFTFSTHPLENLYRRTDV